jgi:hypothetical protein
LIHTAQATVGNKLPTAIKLASPITLSSIDLTHSTDFRNIGPKQAVNVTTPVLSGFAIHVSPGSAKSRNGHLFHGKVSVTVLPGPSGSYLIQVAGSGLVFSKPTLVTLPNTAKASPGTVLPLLTINSTGGITQSGLLRVSSDGRLLLTVSGGVAGPCLILPPQPVQPTVASDSTTITNTSSGNQTLAAANLSATVGATLDTSLAIAGLSAVNTSYTITPQPLPANMTFNRLSGELVFKPAPGQAGTYSFTITARDGKKVVVRPVEIVATQPKLASTQLSGQVVDENGKPLADMPVSIDGMATVTDVKGNFTIAGIASNPGPLSTGGAVAGRQNRQPLTAPVQDLLGHTIYSNVNNVIAQRLILPTIHWTTQENFLRNDTSTKLDLSSVAMPGFRIRQAEGVGSTFGSLQVGTLTADESFQHMPVGMRSDMITYKASGVDPSQPVELTLPNSVGYAPGTVQNLLTFNMLTGGHDITGKMVVSADGKTMTSLGMVWLTPPKPIASKETTVAQGSISGRISPAIVPAADRGTLSGCLATGPALPSVAPNNPCPGCEPTAARIAAAGADALAADAMD